MTTIVTVTNAPPRRGYNYLKIGIYIAAEKKDGTPVWVRDTAAEPDGQWTSANKAERLAREYAAANGLPFVAGIRQWSRRAVATLDEVTA